MVVEDVIAAPFSSYSLGNSDFQKRFFYEIKYYLLICSSNIEYIHALGLSSFVFIKLYRTATNSDHDTALLSSQIRNTIFSEIENTARFLLLDSFQLFCIKFGCDSHFIPQWNRVITLQLDSRKGNS